MPKDNDCMKETLLKKEQYYLDSVNPSLNVCKIANSPLGVKRNIMFSTNLSRARRGMSTKPREINKIRPKFVTSYETKLRLSGMYAGVKVKMFDKYKNLVKEFTSISKTAKFLGVSDRTVSKIMNTGISYDNYTYTFETVVGYPIIVTNIENNSIKHYCSINTAAKDMGISGGTVSNYINTNKLLKGKYSLYRFKPGVS
jgi:hypothetical protein